MRAQLLAEPAPIESRPLDLMDHPDPEPSSREIRVRIEACAVCRTDLHLIEEDIHPAKLPVIPGHQIVGTVEQTGFDACRFQLGDRVGIAWLRRTCGRCEHCERGNENLCASSEYTGSHADGGYAESCVVDENYAYPLDNGLSAFETAPLLCSGIIGYRALQRAQLAPANASVCSVSAPPQRWLRDWRGTVAIPFTRSRAVRRILRKREDWAPSGPAHPVSTPAMRSTPQSCSHRRGRSFHRRCGRFVREAASSSPGST